MNFRIFVFGAIVTLCFLIVTIHLAYIQFVQGKDLSEKAYNQQIERLIISPSRGTIFDTKGEILAQSIAVDTISLNPENEYTYIPDA